MRSTMRPQISWNRDEGCYDVQLGNGFYAEIFEGGLYVRKKDHNVVFDSTKLMKPN